jgi:hypothetical protein
MGRGLAVEFRNKEIHVGDPVADQLSEPYASDSGQAPRSVVPNKAFGDAQPLGDLACIQ